MSTLSRTIPRWGYSHAKKCFLSPYLKNEIREYRSVVGRVERQTE